MSVKISVIAPVLNEVDFIGYSIMAGMPFIHEFIYSLDANSSDGTRELLHYIKDKYAHEKLVILDTNTFHPHDMDAYNSAFNSAISKMTGDAAMFLHPDMIITEAPKELSAGPLAWYTHITSYANNLNTVISKGRCDRWKNIHAKKFGLTYYGAYGSVIEDFYHSAITGKSYKHYGPDFSKYPFQVSDSGIKINHYCENKDYGRRLEKMVLCLKTLYPYCSDEKIQEMAIYHPRVTLEASSTQFGDFEFQEAKDPVPDVFATYGDEFKSFKKEAICK